MLHVFVFEFVRTVSSDVAESELPNTAANSNRCGRVFDLYTCIHHEPFTFQMKYICFAKIIARICDFSTYCYAATFIHWFQC